MQEITCLIVDDESIFRDYLKMVIDWDSYGFTIVGEAQNGLQALELAEELKPDVMFIDIDMPQLNGLSLIEQLQARRSGIHFILITGFWDFQYTHKAIQLSVFDYLRKPFTRNELLTCIMKISGYVMECRNEATEYGKTRGLARNHLLLQLLHGEYTGSDSDLAKSFQAYEVPLVPESPFAVVAIKSYDFMDLWSKPREKQAVLYAIQNLFMETAAKQVAFSLLRIDDTQLAFLVNPPAGGLEALAAILSRVMELCDKYLQLHMTMGVGNPHSGVDGLRMSWLEALAAQNHNLEKNQFQVTLYADISPKQFDSTYYYRILNRALPAYLSLMEHDKTEKLTRSRALLIEASKYMCKHYMDELTIDSIAGALYVSSSYLRKVFAQGINTSVMHVLLEIRLHTACRLLVEERYSIAQVAEMVGYKEPAYFSKVFKKYFGISPSGFEVKWGKK